MPGVKRNAPRTGPSSYKRAKRAESDARNVLAYGGKGKYTAIKRSPRVEIKYYSSTPFVGAPVSSIPSIASLASQIPIGDSGDERNGRTVRLLDSSFTYSQRYTNATSTEMIRVIVFLWKPNTIPVGTDILDSNNIFSQYQQEQIQNYKVLFDKMHHIVPQFPTQGVDQFWTGKVKINADQVYGAAATVNAQQNKIYMLYVTDNIGAGTISSFTVKAQTRFLDL